jgi:S1-C subfamily serine protease
VLSAVLVLLVPAAPRAQGTLSALQTDVDQIARRARPTVVGVYAQRVARKENGETATPPRVQARVGSGVAISASEVLTTASVVLGADRVVIRTSNGIHAEATIVGADPISNVALLRVSTVRLPVIPLAAKAAEIGDWVVSLGTSYRAQPTQSVGNVAYRHREPGMTLLQLTNLVYPGNSGAAAVNPRGELVGIVQGELGTPEVLPDTPEERRPSTASFVVPIEAVRPIVESLRREGRVRHGFLGVTTRALTVASVRPGASPTPIGALVEGIVPGGPADQIGLRHGDLIVAYKGERVEYPEQLARWVSATRPGEHVEIVWAREENQMTATARLSESPDAVPAWLATWPDPDAESPGSRARVSQIQREIRRLNDELSRLKSTPGSGR